MWNVLVLLLPGCRTAVLQEQQLYTHRSQVCLPFGRYGCRYKTCFYACVYSLGPRSSWSAPPSIYCDKFYLHYFCLLFTVCGFEAFINGKHIIGEVKEKEQARNEYREAISQGHGAYLMDEETPVSWDQDLTHFRVSGYCHWACVLLSWNFRFYVNHTFRFLFVPIPTGCFHC